MEITNLQPNNAAIGYPVIITVDTDIAKVDSVRVGNIYTHRATVNDGRNIYFNVPAGLEEGEEYEVSIQLPDGNTITAAERLKVNEAPDLDVEITSMSPQLVTFSNGDYTDPFITLNGTNLNLVDYVYFNNTSVLINSRSQTKLGVTLNSRVKPGILKRLKISYSYNGQTRNVANFIRVNS